MDLDSYEYTGEELLDRLDSLKAAHQTVRFQLELYSQERLSHNGAVPPGFIDTPHRLEHASRRFREAHEELDTLFDEEYGKFPIQSSDDSMRGEAAVTVMETDAENYREIVKELENIGIELSGGDPSMDYSELPSTFAITDFSDELIHEYRKLENTYELLEEAGI
ncbi:MAG: hypothetical protein ABEJ36_00145 [Candidatus Nanosalina sp.]